VTGGSGLASMVVRAPEGPPTWADHIGGSRQFARDGDHARSDLTHLVDQQIAGLLLWTGMKPAPSEQRPRWPIRLLCSQRVHNEPLTNAGTVVVSNASLSFPIERSSSLGKRFLRRLIFVVGCGHSGLTMLTIILGAHRRILH
jgi:hypothetical protein